MDLQQQHHPQQPPMILYSANTTASTASKKASKNVSFIFALKRQLWRDNLYDLSLKKKKN